MKNIKRMKLTVLLVSVSLSLLLFTLLFCYVYLFGISSTRDELSKEEYILYNNIDQVNYGSQTTRFGEEEYKCSGNCYCLDERRVSTPSVVRGVTYMIAALSSVVAMNLANEYFEVSCKRELIGSCTNAESIKSEVTMCSNAEKDTFSVSDEQGNVQFSYTVDQSKFLQYSCSGNCSLPYEVDEFFIDRKWLIGPKGAVKNKHDCTKEENMRFKNTCKSMNTQGIIDIPKDRFKTARQLNKQAVQLFLMTRLVPFCEHNSKFKEKAFEKIKKAYDDFVHYHSGIEFIIEVKDEYIAEIEEKAKNPPKSLCSGYLDESQGDKYGGRKNIICNEIVQKSDENI